MERPIRTLFIKYLADQCSEAEIMLLLDHFNIPENESLLKQFILAELEQQDELDHDAEPDDLDDRLTRIYTQVKIKTQTRSRRLSVLTVHWHRFAAAAVVIISAGAGVFYFYKKQLHESAILAAAESNITPGRDQAILTLADGRKISLHEVSDGEIAEQSGFHITKTADGQLVYTSTESISEEDGETQYNTIEAPVGGKWQVVLPDKSHVWLNAQSSLTYPTRFRGKERKVFLKGEAYFEVAHNTAMPFKVESHGQTVEVLGTHFNVMAYADEPVMKTTLLEGAVKIATAKTAQLLRPGEQAHVKDNQVKVTKDADLEEVVAWKNGYFKFNEDLQGIMSKISRWYNVEIEYEELPAPGYTFAGKISRERELSEVLKVMEYTGKVHFTIKERRIIVRK